MLGTQNQPAVKPNIIGQGRIVMIDLPFQGVEFKPMNPDDVESPIIWKFTGEKGFWINIYDHRMKTRQAYVKFFEKEIQVIELVREFRRAMPCLGRFSLKGNTQYISLTDLGVEDMFDSGDHGLRLTLAGSFDHDAFRVIRDEKSGKMAMHQATKICLLEPRPAKPEISSKTEESI
ncbi:MAG: hypothetical protein WCP93_01010 [Candidatus Berkelbacteria bacterium]